MARILGYFEDILYACMSLMTKFLETAVSDLCEAVFKQALIDVPKEVSVQSANTTVLSTFAPFDCCYKLADAIDSNSVDFNDRLIHYLEHFSGHIQKVAVQLKQEPDQVLTFATALGLVQLESPDVENAKPECRICLEVIAEHRIAHLEQCSHLYCELCLRAWMAENAGQAVSCPTCRVVSTKAIFDERPLEEEEKQAKLNSVVYFLQNLPDDASIRSLPDDFDVELIEDGVSE